MAWTVRTCIPMGKEDLLHFSCIEKDPELARCERHGPMSEFSVILRKGGHLWILKPGENFYFCPLCTEAIVEDIGVEPKPETRQKLGNLALSIMVKNHWDGAKESFVDLGKGRLKREEGEMRILIDEPSGEIPEGVIERLNEFGDWSAYKR